ncbi:MAG TPA: type II toxin-antitoxin system RelE/ParE family toxin [Pyrinomonadaceae bacterium]|nr:type II toxin-antitoxin system RelE/ParE family toxin [Pyrinomonadaceae bacterium]
MAKANDSFIPTQRAAAIVRDWKVKASPADFSAKLIRQMDALHQADEAAQLSFPGYGLHELKGERAGTWAMKVNKNWRLTFRFQDGNASEVDLEDYH